jgi:D-alanyl-lipoteichoic acid acyltransferase DltB (MBOAT superfamily)
MLFNSIDFAVFLPLVFSLYWFATNRNLRLQNFLIVSASYIFYGWWDWRFLSLIIFSTIVDYTIGRKLKIEETQIKRKALLLSSIFINLGFLGVFKYYNFFLDNFITAFSIFGKDIQANSLNIILPVGISFYTFQTLSYTIDVYKKKLEPTKDFIAFSAFVSFFPQLVAGPIERAKHLLPQFYKQRVFSLEKASQGLLLICWGLFMKVVIADNLALYVNTVFNDIENFKGMSLIWAMLFFTFQIYGDFAGYSYIAIGTAKLFSFDLMTNFRQPYLALSFSDFWKRWHISLSTWFRDYVYIPLGGNKKGSMKTNINVLVTFLVSGLWHGANWTFVLWGGVHGILNIISTKAKATKTPKVLKISIVFIATMFTWVIFRANSIHDVIYFLENFFKIKESGIIGLPTMGTIEFIKLLVFIVILFIADIIISYFEKHKIRLSNKPSILIIVTSLLLLSLYLFGSFEVQEFIYFQF